MTDLLRGDSVVHTIQEFVICWEQFSTPAEIQGAFKFLARKIL